MNKEVLHMWGDGDFVNHNKNKTFVILDKYDKYVDILRAEQFYNFCCNLDELNVKVYFYMHYFDVEIWKLSASKNAIWEGIYEN